MSRPLGSGLAASKSNSASAASMGRDFLYPTAFIGRFSLGIRQCRCFPILPAVSWRELQVVAGNGLAQVIVPRNRAISGAIGASTRFYSGTGTLIFPSSFPRESIHDRCPHFHGVAGPYSRHGARDVTGPPGAGLAPGYPAFL